MKNLMILSVALVFGLILNTNAQIFNGSTSAVVQHKEPQALKNIPEPENKASEDTQALSSETEADDDDGAKLLSREEIEALIKAEQPAEPITPEQKAEIELGAKKSMRTSIKKQSLRERKDFIDVMTSAEKIKARRQALVEGQDAESANIAENSIEKPSINPAVDKEMENYLFEKARLSGTDKVSDVK